MYGGNGTALRASRYTGEGPTHGATAAAQLDKVTELAVALWGYARGVQHSVGRRHDGRDRTRDASLRYMNPFLIGWLVEL